MAGTPFVIVGTPEYRIDQRALALAHKKPEFLVDYKTWAAAHGYGGAPAGDAYGVKPDAIRMKTTRVALRERFSGLRDQWNGECWFVGHSQGACSIFIGGYTPFTKNPNYGKPVSGAAYGAFLGEVLPKPPGDRLHLPILACWLGEPKDAGAMRFLTEVLSGVQAANAMVGVRAYAYATKFETWYGDFDFVSINGIRRTGFDGRMETYALLEKLRKQAARDPHAMNGAFNLYADDAFRVKAEQKKRTTRDDRAEFGALADLLTKEYRSSAAKYQGQKVAKRAFTTFFLQGGKLKRDKKNEVSTDRGPGKVEDAVRPPG